MQPEALSEQKAPRARAHLLLEQLSDDFANIHAQILRSLAQIRRGDRGIGAGIVWREDGLILTNAHVVRGRVPGDLGVQLGDGREYAARVVAVDREHDLAALTANASGLTPIALGDSRALHAGEMVLAFGFPFGVTGGATVGAVITAGSARVGAVEEDAPWLAASLHLRPGHSGGPMVDSQGRLVGINTMMNGPDVGLAVPVAVAREFVDGVLAGRHSLKEPLRDRKRPLFPGHAVRYA